MEFRTVVDLPRQYPLLEPHSRVLVLGSCFAEHVGQRIAHTLPAGQVEVNPFGVLYNPESLFIALSLLRGDEADVEESVFEGRDGMWHSWLCAGVCSATSRDACRSNVTACVERSRQLLKTANMLVVTMGTSHVYRLADGGMVVANCHKERADRFVEDELSVDHIAQSWQTLLLRLIEENEHLQVVFTVSPYRYAKYGFHTSALSKARLLQATDEIVRAVNAACAAPVAYYFPAYEILLDELRDYRFYATDMLHPSEQAVDYIWQRFREWCFSPRLNDFSQEREAICRDMAHRPLHPDSEAHQVFLARLEERKRAFLDKWGLAEW